MKYQIERPVNDFPCHTYRNLDPNAPVNKHLDSSLGSKIADLLNALSEVLIRFDTNPNYYTKEDYFTLIELLRGLLSYLYVDLGTHPFNGIISDLTVNPLDSINPGLYITHTTGIYEHFKDVDGNSIEVTDADITENVVVLNPKSEEGVWYYEKVTIPVKVNLTNLNSIFRVAENRDLNDNYLLSEVYEIKDGPDEDSPIFNGVDQVILFKINADNKWLAQNAEKIKINFFRLAAKKALSQKNDNFKPQKLGVLNSLFTLLNDECTSESDGYSLSEFLITPVKLKDCKIVKNLDNAEFYNLEELKDIKDNVWFVLPYSTFKLFRRLFSAKGSFLLAYLNDNKMRLSGCSKHMFWHPLQELNGKVTSPIKLKVGFNISYVDINNKEYFSDIQAFLLKFNNYRCKLIQ